MMADEATSYSVDVAVENSRRIASTIQRLDKRNALLEQQNADLRYALENLVASLVRFEAPEVTSSLAHAKDILLGKDGLSEQEQAL